MLWLFAAFSLWTSYCCYLIKEKYEKDLKDTRALELMYAEEATILDKRMEAREIGVDGEPKRFVEWEVAEVGLAMAREEEERKLWITRKLIPCRKRAERKRQYTVFINHRGINTTYVQLN